MTFLISIIACTIIYKKVFIVTHLNNRKKNNVNHKYHFANKSHAICDIFAFSLIQISLTSNCNITSQFQNIIIVISSSKKSTSLFYFFICCTSWISNFKSVLLFSNLDHDFTSIFLFNKWSKQNSNKSITKNSMTQLRVRDTSWLFVNEQTTKIHTICIYKCDLTAND